MDEIDWSNCWDVERTPGKVSGAWCVKGTRIPVRAILDNAEDCTVEEICGPDIFPDLSVEVVERILAYAACEEMKAVFRREWERRFEHHDRPATVREIARHVGHRRPPQRKGS
jgi:uncharacterized protein (DUF433 family)